MVGAQRVELLGGLVLLIPPCGVRGGDSTGQDSTGQLLPVVPVAGRAEDGGICRQRSPSPQM